MKKIILALSLFVATAISVSAQNEGKSVKDEPQSVSMTYRQSDEVRKALNLDSKQFEKVYKAYKTYNDAVYGSEESRPQRPRPGGMGRPGGPGMGAPGGMGGERPDFGGGRPPMHGSDRDMGMPPAGNAPKNIDPAKLEKTKTKQEAKLAKSMKKALKDTSLYDRWLSLRDRQLKESVPPMPRPDRNRP